MKTKKKVPVGMFFCKGCQVLRKLAERTSKYSKTCSHCTVG